METGVMVLARCASRRAAHGFAFFSSAVLVLVGVSGCAGRSTREGGERGGDGGSGAVSGDAGASSSGSPSVGGSAAGDASMGGVSVGASGGSSGDGSSTGATSGTGPITTTVCGAPLAPGSCRGYEPSYWFDASTGLCMPFVYGGCEGNANRFAQMRDCYATCGGRGERDDAACATTADCMPRRLGEPCCTTSVREFIAVNRAAAFSCSDPRLGCTACAADCETTPNDGYIGALCNDGYCMPFDARDFELDQCETSADCSLRYGSECCEDCAPDQYPSKLVALNVRANVCPDPPMCGDCTPPSDAVAECVDGSCHVAYRAVAP